MTKDIELIGKTEDSFSVRVSGATFRNLERFARFLEAHGLEGASGPFGDSSLDLQECTWFAGMGFTGEEAREKAETKLGDWFDSDEPSQDPEYRALLADLDKLSFEGWRGEAKA